MTVRIAIQQEDFNLAEEYEWLRQISPAVGAVVTFSGLVRDFESTDGARNAIDSLSLQHYPGMTESLLQEIVDQAMRRWPLLGVTVIHRVGKLLPAEQIVFVGVASQHRAAAYEAAQCVMDYLKTRATFWKKVDQNGREHWVESKDSDQVARQRWAADD